MFLCIPNAYNIANVVDLDWILFWYSDRMIFNTSLKLFAFGFFSIHFDIFGSIMHSIAQSLISMQRVFFLRSNYRKTSKKKFLFFKLDYFHHNENDKGNGCLFFCCHLKWCYRWCFFFSLQQKKPWILMWCYKNSECLFFRCHKMKEVSLVFFCVWKRERERESARGTKWNEKKRIKKSLNMPEKCVWEMKLFCNGACRVIGKSTLWTLI